MKKEIAGTVVILAGGQAQRMGGEKKGFLDIGGKPILDRLLHVLSPLFDQTVLVVKSPDQLAELNPKIPVIVDQFSDSSSLTGIQAGLAAAQTDRIFVCAWDMPFLQSNFIKTVWNLDQVADIVVPEWEGRYQPLCAVYRQTCLPVITRHIQKKNYKIETLFSEVTTRVMSEQEVRPADPEGLSFININRPEDLELAREIMAKDVPER